MYRAGLAGRRFILWTSGLEIPPYRRLAYLHLQIPDLTLALVLGVPVVQFERPRHLLL